MSKRNVYLFEVNDIIANQVKLPYSTGLIWSYCILDKQITDNYELAGWVYWRQDMNVVLESIKDPDVIGFNCFVWNYEYNHQLAAEIKKRYPDCLIVYGGWQTPIADRNKGFFHECPYVDIAVHGEGELTFKDILLERLKEQPDWKSVSGCSIPRRMLSNDEESQSNVVKHGLKLVGTEPIDMDDELACYVTEPRARIKKIDVMPSPYLNGLFDTLIDDCPYTLESTIETTRGCPYSCTFCEIGTQYYHKVQRQSFEKVKKELDWISDHKVEFIYNADSNFGMFPEHLDVTKYMVKKKAESGYPAKHRCDWSKNQADKVIELAKLFTEADMDKGITIALQSMNPEVLKAIKRKNVDNGKLEKFLSMYNAEELPSYVELILGLPEETLDSFIEGVCQVMELGQHNYIGIYSLTALPNTPFGDPDYIAEYGLNVINTYTAFNHYDISEQNTFEREDMIAGSNTMTYDEYKHAHMFRWVIMFGHYLGTTQYISRFLRNTRDISYRDFYESLLQYATDNPDTFIGRELQKTRKNLEAVLVVEQPWGRIIPEVRKDFAWDFEEATAIRISQNQDLYYSELRNFLKEAFDVEYDEIIQQLFDYQRAGVLDPAIEYPIRKEFDYNFYDVITWKSKLREKQNTLEFNAENYSGDYYKWGIEKLWWGRRIGACKTKAVKVNVGI